MDKGIVQVFTLEGSDFPLQLDTSLQSAGYKPHFLKLETLTPDSTCAGLNIPRLLFLESLPSIKKISQLRSQQGIFHLVLGGQHVLDQLSTADLIAADLCFLPCSASELALRITRSHSLLMPVCEIDCVGKDNIETNMLGEAPLFIDAIAKIKRYSMINAPLLITGETGTGKELAARAIHYSGISKEGPFQALNCGAIPDHLVENELFGHAKGAYTDARAAHRGLVELADGGTLFLDEVDALSPRAQGTLLRFLQDGTYRELGSGVEKHANLRVISATNQNLEKLSQKELFRKDLIYRLNTLTLPLPSLNERESDIPLLANHFIKQCKLQFQQGEKVFHPIAITKMKQHNWPGNVRELESYVKRVYLDSPSPIVTQGPSDKSCPHPVDHQLRASNSNSYSLVNDLSFVEAKRLAVEEFESSYVASLLKETQGNVSRAARMAGKERRCFGKLLKKYQIDRDIYA